MFFILKIFKSKNITDMQKHINNCLESLAKMKETHKLGCEPEYVKAGKTSMNCFLLKKKFINFDF